MTDGKRALLLCGGCDCFGSIFDPFILWLIT